MSVFDEFGFAEGRCESVIRDLWDIVGQPEILETVVDQLLEKPLQLPPYAEDPCQDGLEPTAD